MKHTILFIRVTREYHVNWPGLCWSIEEVTSNIAPTFRDTHCGLACDVCDRLLGTSYISCLTGRGGGTTWFLAEQNGGSVESHGNKTRLCWSSGEVTSNIAPVFGDFNCGLVTAFYRDQSLFIAWGWRAGDLRGGHLTFRRTKGGISRNWEAQMGDCCKLWKDSEEEPLKFA